MSMTRALLLLPLLVGCQRDAYEANASKTQTGSATTTTTTAARGTAGTERGDCRPDKSCDPGLLCLSNLCVAPPAADCQKLAETLASYEVGNYAPKGKRDSVVAEKKAKCEAERVTKDEEKCVDDAKDKWAIAKCVPRLYPELAPGKGLASDCEIIIGKMQQMMGEAGRSSDPQVQQILAKATTAIRASCMEDGWPDALRQCIITQPVATTGGDPMRACESLIPPGLTEKMQRRMSGM